MGTAEGGTAMSARAMWFVVAMAILLSPILSYLMARVGEPRAEWLYCTVLGLC